MMYVNLQRMHLENMCTPDCNGIYPHLLIHYICIYIYLSWCLARNKKGLLIYTILSHRIEQCRSSHTCIIQPHSLPYSIVAHEMKVSVFQINLCLFRSLLRHGNRLIMYPVITLHVVGWMQKLLHNSQDFPCAWEGPCKCPWY
jgi:hypothetical protein